MPRGREELRPQSLLPGSLLLVLLLVGGDSGPSGALCVPRLLPTSVPPSSGQRSLRGSKDGVRKWMVTPAPLAGSLPLTFPPG